MIPLTPSLATLRAHARGELTSPESLEVRRWLVRCTDPRVIAFLEFVLEEKRQESEDASLSRTARELGRRFLALLRRFDAAVDSIVEPDLLGAPALLAPSPSPVQEGIRLIGRPSTDPAQARKFDVMVTVGSGRRQIAVLAVTDSGDACMLDHYQWTEPLQVPHPRRPIGCEQSASDGRVTIWAVLADRPFVNPDFDRNEDLVAWLDAVVSVDGVRVLAARLNALSSDEGPDA